MYLCILFIRYLQLTKNSDKISIAKYNASSSQLPKIKSFKEKIYCCKNKAKKEKEELY